MTYPPEHRPPSPDAPAVLDALGYVPPPRPDMGQLPEPEEYEVAEPGAGRVLAVIGAAVVALIVWWGLA